MPTYDYQCRSCGVITEVVHSMLEDGPSECQRCGGRLRMVVHPTGIIFKGSGFYKTDSRSSSSRSVDGAGSSATPPSPDASPTKTSTDATSSDRGSGQPSSAADAPKGSAGSD